MITRKKLTILTTVIFFVVGILLSLALAFTSGNNRFNTICQDSKTTDQPLNYCGWENCEMEQGNTYVSDPSVSFYYVVFISIILLLLISSTLLERIIVWIMGSAIMITLLMLSQILLNAFPFTSYSGWQDVCWVVENKTQMLQNYIDINTRPTALPFNIIMMLLFMTIAFLGPLLTSLLLKRSTALDNKSKIPYNIKFIAISIGLQILVFIITFPITIMFFLGWE